MGIAFLCLLAAWLMSNPPFIAPDEQAHYLRAMTITNGALLGPKVALPPLPSTAPGGLKTQRAWMDHDTRGVHVAPNLSPPGMQCLDGRPNIGSGGCVEPVVNGDYPPLAYVLPALALRPVHSAETGDWLGRAAAATPVLALLLLAVALTAPLGSWSLLGLLVAVTPMVLFVGSILNSSGLDITASLASAAAGLRIAVAPDRAPSWAWAALAISGAVAILSWQLGPWFVALTVIVCAALIAPPRWAALRAHRRAVLVTGGLLGGALVLYIVYAAVSGLAHAGIVLSSPISRVRAGGHQFVFGVLPDAVGHFGSLTVRLPGVGYWVWWLGGLMLIGSALWLGNRRERVVIALASAIAVGFPVAFYGFVYSRSGFGLQGRQVLPLLMLVAMTAGHVLQRAIGEERRLTRAVVPGAIGLIAAFQLFAWWINARHSAGEPHAVWFLGRPLWRPPLGWWPWTALACAGAVSLAAAAVSVRRQAGRRPEDRRPIRDGAIVGAT